MQQPSYYGIKRLFTSVLVKKKKKKKRSRICTASQGAAIVHDSSPLVTSKANSEL